MAEKNYEILECIGVLSENKGGWKKELNIVKWFDNAPSFDLRSWSADHSKMGKGIGLSNEELEAGKNILFEGAQAELLCFTFMFFDNFFLY